MVRMDDTAVLVTAVGRSDADPNRDFFPLTVNYQERTYAGGKIPGGAAEQLVLFFYFSFCAGGKIPWGCRVVD